MADEDYIAWEMLYGSSAPSDDWQPPVEWIPVPEPGDYDIYILIQAAKNDQWNNGMKFSLYLCRESDGEIGHGHIHCDFGDGTILDLYPYMNYGNIGHTYIEEGQYLIHITADENTSIGQECFSACYLLKSAYLLRCTSVGDRAFQNCYNLQEIIVAEDCTFGANCFQNCRSLPSSWQTISN